MIKLARLLDKYRSLVIVVLFVPLLGIFFSKEFHLEMVPPNPHLQFKATFKAPSRSADEILTKVTQPVEKIFNGLPHLLGSQSQTRNEISEITLTFHEKADASTTYLNIQEKMDRIRLILPRDVESYRIIRVSVEKPADLLIEASEDLPLTRFAHALSSYRPVIEKAEPSIDQVTRLEVIPFPEKLAQNGVSISEFVTALKSMGLSTSIGRQSGIMVETGRSFESLEELKSAPIGSRGHRPLRLTDVAEIQIKPPQPIKKLRLWIDTSRLGTFELSRELAQAIPGLNISYPFWRSLLEQSFHPIFLIIVAFLLQFLVIHILHMPLKSLFYFAILGGLISVHFLFWKGLMSPPLTVIDLHALALTLIIGSIFQATLYVRTRSFFSPGEFIKKTPKSLDQAKLFSLVELIPTFLTLALGLWIVSMPLLNTAINLPSRQIAQSLFSVGLPILFAFLIVFPLLTSGEFLQQNILLRNVKMHWSVPHRLVIFGIVTVFTGTVVSPFLFQHFPIGVSSAFNKSKDSLEMVASFRGYENRLIYKKMSDPSSLETESLPSSFTYFSKNQVTPARVFEFSPNGMRFLSQLDLMGFANSLKDLQQNKTIGFLTESSQKYPIEISSSHIRGQDLGDLLFASKSDNLPSRPVHILTEPRWESISSQVLRDNMVTSDQVTFEDNYSGHVFLESPHPSLVPSAWTQYLLNQFHAFQKSHWISLVFLFLLFAIYLNSFIRAFFITSFAMATAGFVYMCRLFLPGSYHADSLWMLYLGGFLALFQILVLTRIIDIERTRGADRDLTVKEVQRELAPAVYLCSWTFVLALFIAGVTELFPFLPSLGFWKEGLFISLTSAALLVFSTHILFPLFYLNSEEVVSRMAFRLYRWAQFWR